MGRKKSLPDHRQYGFRMPLEHYDLLVEVASARGVDLAALLNQVVADAMPGLRAWLARHKAGGDEFTALEQGYLRSMVQPDLREAVAGLVNNLWDMLPSDREAMLKRMAKISSPTRDIEVAKHARVILMFRESGWRRRAGSGEVAETGSEKGQTEEPKA